MDEMSEMNQLRLSERLSGYGNDIWCSMRDSLGRQPWVDLRPIRSLEIPVAGVGVLLREMVDRD